MYTFRRVRFVALLALAVPASTWAAPAGIVPAGDSAVALPDAAPLSSRSLTGDVDHDGDVDLIDSEELYNCLTGPGGGVLPGCEGAALDGDADVDLLDFALLQSHFTGHGPIADVDRDDDVDLDDAALLIGCMAGPGASIPPDCDNSDVDKDNDIDMEDFAFLQIEFNGTAATEACYVGNCGCLDLPVDECTVQSGTPQGPGTDCNSNGPVTPACSVTAPDFVYENTSGHVASVPPAAGTNVTYDWTYLGDGQITSTPPYTNEVEFETFDVSMGALFIYITVIDEDTGCCCNSFHRVLVFAQ